MGSPFAASIFTQHEFEFDLATGETFRSDRGQVVTATKPTKVKFFIKKGSSRAVAVGNKIDYQPTHKAYVTAVDGVASTSIDLPPGSVGKGESRVIKIPGRSEESISALTKVWGLVYSVEIGDRFVSGGAI
jgi:hypothetical protein